MTKRLRHIHVGNTETGVILSRDNGELEDIQAYENTDTELYREPAESEGMSYYSNSVHVTKDGLIGMNVGGYVFVRPIADWHKAMAALSPQSGTEGAEAQMPSEELLKQEYQRGRQDELDWWDELFNWHEPTFIGKDKEYLNACVADRRAELDKQGHKK